MANVRRLARGGASIQVSDTELTLVRSAVQAVAGTQDIDLGPVTSDTDRQTLEEALELRAAALRELASGLMRYEEE